MAPRSSVWVCCQGKINTFFTFLFNLNKADEKHRRHNEPDDVGVCHPGQEELVVGGRLVQVESYF